MKRFFGRKPAMTLAVIFACAGLTAGCSSADDTEEETDEIVEVEEAEDEDTDETEVQENMVGAVSYIGSSYISVEIYTSDDEIENYAILDSSTLTLTEDAASITTDDDTEYYRAAKGLLIPIERDDIEKENMIASVTTEDGVHQMILLDTEISEETEAKVAEVAEVTNDSISLTLYSYIGEDEESAIVIDISQYEASEDTEEYIIPDEAEFLLAEDGYASEGEASEIEVGDIIVIYTDANGGTTIIVYNSVE
ncbi:MAG: hypothetical protein LUE88_08750 [Clostridiales bacterium]|nr:hypothetical protein [Clostridiales bacterium]